MEYKDSLFKLHLSILYEVQGNYTKMTEIMRSSGILSCSSDKYFQYNLFLALHMQGLIKILWKESGIDWVVNSNYLSPEFESDTLFGEELLACSDPYPKILSNNLGLVFAKDNDPSRNIDLNNYCSLGEVADKILLEESVASMTANEMEIYSFDENKWEQKLFSGEDSALARLKNRFSGYKYYIFMSEVGRVYRVIEPEWIFVLAVYLSNNQFKELFKLDDGGLKIHSSFRLPSVFMHYLANNSDQIYINHFIEYKGLSEASYESFLHYLNPGVAV